MPVHALRNYLILNFAFRIARKISVLA